jgi:hypothetical protein
LPESLSFYLLEIFVYEESSRSAQTKGAPAASQPAGFFDSELSYAALRADVQECIYTLSIIEL